MAFPNKISAALSENCLTLLCWDDEGGKIVANILEANLFEGDYQLIAERAIAFWRQHGEAPKIHTADLMADILEDPEQGKADTIRRTLHAMLQLYEQINKPYVLGQLRRFRHLQMMKATILEAADKLNSQQEMAIEEVEAMWQNLMKVRELEFSAGMRLHEISRLLQYLEDRAQEFRTGIKEFDLRGIVPARGTIFLVLGGAGRGKTWELIHLAKHNLLQRKKVLHVTMEMGEEQNIQRYHQSLFAAPKRDQDYTITTLITDDKKLTGFGTEILTPTFGFDSSALDAELEGHVKHLGQKAENLIVKRFPPRSLTIGQLNAYLDRLEQIDGFIPDLLIIDSPYLMKIDTTDFRLRLGRLYEEVRGIAVERNIAICASHQISREGVKAITSTSTHVAEDWSLIATSDIVVTYSCTDAEKRYGLGRLYVSKCRDDEDRFGVLITQSYDLGQFVLESYRLPDDYWEVFKGLSKEEETEEDSE